MIADQSVELFVEYGLGGGRCGGPVASFRLRGLSVRNLLQLATELPCADDRAENTAFALTEALRAERPLDVWSAGEAPPPDMGKPVGLEEVLLPSDAHDQNVATPERLTLRAAEHYVGGA